MTASPDAAGYLLLSETDLLSVAELAVVHARHIGAESASVLASENAGTTIRVRDGAIASAVRDGGQSLSITVYDRGRTGNANTEALEPQAVRRVVERALAIARQVEPDPEAGLADPDWIAFEGPDVPLFAPSNRSPGELSAIAREIEAAALARSEQTAARVRIDESAASSSDYRWARAMTNGFARAASGSMSSRACVAIAEDDAGMARDWWSVVERREEALPSAATIAAAAVDRAVAKLGGRALPTLSAPVLLDARTAITLVNELVSGLTGGAQQQRSTFLIDALGSQRLASHVDIEEDPFEPYGLASSAWDSEGVAGTSRKIVRAGVVEGYLLNARSARKLGLRSTGNADGPTNLRFVSNAAGTDDTDALIRRMGRGLFVTSFMGGGFNATTGSYSKAVEGFWIDHGAIVHPVQDVTIAGALPDMLRNIVAIGCDLFRQGPMRTGPILLENMRIAGR